MELTKEEETMADKQSGIRALGATFSVSDGLTPVKFLQVGFVSSIGEIGGDGEEIDVTHLSSVGNFKEFIKSFQDAGEIPITCRVVPDSLLDETAFPDAIDARERVRALRDNGMNTRFKIIYNSGIILEFDGFVKSYKYAEVTPESVEEINVTVRVSGAIEYTEVVA